MSTLTRELERPAYVDAPPLGQLSFAGAAARTRSPEQAAHAPLSERLRQEHDHGAVVETTRRSRTTVLRRGGEATLDELLVGAWEGLSVHRPVACPVCAGVMQPRVEVAGGACGDCGAELR